ncbi:hypothetical protein KAI56_01740 [Candidatus Parcubacteria bacterium]|nr:hypothetical protein [Candidatus Parcubacteria bacterium]
MIEEKKKLKNTRFVEVEYLKKENFDFIKNDILKENIAINMQYVFFLYSLEREYELPGATTYSVFKTIILYTASIVESLLNYKLKELIKEGKIESSKIMTVEDKYIHIADLHIVSPKERICGVKKIKKYKQLTDGTTFKDLNKVAKNCDLFNERLFKKSEKLREMRNKIHLVALTEIDNKYSQSDIDNVFEIAKDIIDRIENY